MTALTEIKVGSFVTAEFPNQDKNDTLDHNDGAAAERSYRERCKVKRVIEVDLTDWAEITTGLLEDRDLWGRIGGCELSPIDGEAFAVLCAQYGCTPHGHEWFRIPALLDWFRTHSYTVVVILLCEGQSPLAVNTEGRPYAQNVGRIVGG